MTRALDVIAYRRYCALLGSEPDEALSPEARAAAVPAWCTEWLVATQASRNRLRAWARRTPRDQWDADDDPAAVLVALHSVGDPIWPHFIARALCRMPPPVRAYVLRAVTWCPVGLAFGGWAGSHPAREAGRPWFVVLSRMSRGWGDVEWLAGLVAHEAAHCWRLAEPAPEISAATGFVMQTVLDLAMEKVPPEARPAVATIRRDYADEELAVRALCREWGFLDIGA